MACFAQHGVIGGVNNLLDLCPFLRYTCPLLDKHGDQQYATSTWVLPGQALSAQSLYSGLVCPARVRGLCAPLHPCLGSYVHVNTDGYTDVHFYPDAHGYPFPNRHAYLDPHLHAVTHRYPHTYTHIHSFSHRSPYFYTSFSFCF